MVFGQTHRLLTVVGFAKSLVGVALGRPAFARRRQGSANKFECGWETTRTRPAISSAVFVEALHHSLAEVWGTCMCPQIGGRETTRHVISVLRECKFSPPIRCPGTAYSSDSHHFRMGYKTPQDRAIVLYRTASSDSSLNRSLPAFLARRIGATPAR
jgi:hypothetical protein